jgi:hypothetical protein
VAWRCPCGRPGVVTTAPVLPDGTPFPTIYYLTCARAIAACSQLESDGVMAQWSEQLPADPALAEDYRRAHEAYVADRSALAESLALDDGRLGDRSAGGMPERVKCLHALLAHRLAAGPGVNPIGDRVAERLGEFWRSACGSDPVGPGAEEGSDGDKN